MDAEKPWETALTGILFAACLVAVWALLAMISEAMHPTEREISKTDQVTITQRASK